MDVIGLGHLATGSLSSFITMLPNAIVYSWALAQLVRQVRFGVYMKIVLPKTMFMLLLMQFLVLVYAACLGSINGNIYFSNDTASIFILFVTAVMGYLTVREMDDMLRVLKWFYVGIFVISVWRIAAFVGELFGFDIGYWNAQWYTEILIALGYCINLSVLLFGHKTNWRNTVVLFVFLGGMLITLHKPMVWATVATTIIMLLIACRITVAKLVLRRFAVIIILLVLIVSSLNVASGGKLINQYTKTISSRYLKVDSFGRRIGDLDKSGGRFLIWKTGLFKVKERPIFGHGLGISSGLDYRWNYEGTAVHNLPLYLWMATGTIGLVVTLLLLRQWAISAFICLKINGDNQIAIGLIAYAIFCGTIGLVGTLWVSSAVVYVLGAVMGMSYKIGRLANSPAYRK
ncbi:MAG: O-antigen ligase family protein [Paludibacter sp.]|nr:O-antigen ligase family protein [Paludibacter sp.]